MRNKSTCAIAGILLAVIVATAVVSNKYVKNTADTILGTLSSLPDEASKAYPIIEDARSFWEGQRLFLSLTLPQPTLERVSSLFEEASITASCGNSDDYKVSMARLRRAIEDIKELEEISLENIF